MPFLRARQPEEPATADEERNLFGRHTLSPHQMQYGAAFQIDDMTFTLSGRSPSSFGGPWLLEMTYPCAACGNTVYTHRRPRSDNTWDEVLALRARGPHCELCNEVLRGEIEQRQARLDEAHAARQRAVDILMGSGDPEPIIDDHGAVKPSRAIWPFQPQNLWMPDSDWIPQADTAKLWQLAQALGLKVTLYEGFLLFSSPKGVTPQRALDKMEQELERLKAHRAKMVTTEPPAPDGPPADDTTT